MFGERRVWCQAIAVVPYMYNSKHAVLGVSKPAFAPNDFGTKGETMTSTTDIGTMIVSTPKINGGRPRIAGTRITVQHVAIWHAMGWSPEEIVHQYKHLSLAQVHAALAYYFANKEAIDRDIAEEEAFIKQLEREHAQAHGSNA